MKKLITFSAVLISILCAQGIVCAGFDTSGITVSVADYTSALQSQLPISVPINVQEATAEIYAADIWLSYNANLLQVDTVAIGTLTAGWSIVSNSSQPGLIKISLYGTTNALPFGSGSAAIINFKTATPSSGASCVLRLSKTDFNETPVPAANVRNGKFTFALQQFTLTISATKGFVVREPLLPLYNYGASVKLTAVAAPGYIFSGWSQDASGTTNPLTIVMDRNKKIIAQFRQRMVPPPIVLRGNLR